MTSAQPVGLNALLSKINWSAVITGLGAVGAALWLIIQQNESWGDLWKALDSPGEWAVLGGAFLAAYKGTVKGSLVPKKLAKNGTAADPDNDEGA